MIKNWKPVIYIENKLQIIAIRNKQFSGFLYSIFCIDEYQKSSACKISPTFEIKVGLILGLSLQNNGNIFTNARAQTGFCQYLVLRFR